MKKQLVRLLILSAAVAVVLPSVAQSAAPVASATTATATPAPVASLWQMLIPVIVPMIIGLAKMFVPKIPSVALPIIAPLIGAGVDILGHYAGLYQSNGATGAMLGLAAVGVREIYDQTKKLQQTNVPPWDDNNTQPQQPK